MLEDVYKLYNGFYIDKQVGNNAFSFEQRGNKRIFVAPFKEGKLSELEEGRDIVFNEIDQGQEKARTGLKHFLYLFHDKTFIFDNHNHAFFFWASAIVEKIIPPGLKLVHVDQHKDTREPPRFLSAKAPLKEVFDYTNFELNVGNFIKPALEAKMFVELVVIDNKNAFEKDIQGNFVLDLDMDVFSKDMGYIDYTYKFNKIRSLMKRAKLTTIATSPYFMEQEEAIRIIKELLTQK